jgi:sulfate transport system ATP-binding protein
VEPPVALLLNEPFGALDAKARKELRRAGCAACTTICTSLCASSSVTHDQGGSAGSRRPCGADEQRSQLNRSVPPQDVWDHPASPFVYGFLGDVNPFHGRAHEGEVQIGAAQQRVSIRPSNLGAQDAKALEHVRPQRSGRAALTAAPSVSLRPLESARHRDRPDRGWN